MLDQSGAAAISAWESVPFGLLHGLTYEAGYPVSDHKRPLFTGVNGTNGTVTLGWPAQVAATSAAARRAWVGR